MVFFHFWLRVLLSLIISVSWAAPTPAAELTSADTDRPKSGPPSGIRWIFGLESTGETAPLLRWGERQATPTPDDERTHAGFVINRLTLGLGSQTRDGWAVETDFGFRLEPFTGARLESPRLRFRKEAWQWSEAWSYDGWAELRFPPLGPWGNKRPPGWGLRHDHQVSWAPGTKKLEFLLHSGAEHRILSPAEALLHHLDFVAEFGLGALYWLNEAWALGVNTTTGVQHASAAAWSWSGATSSLRLVGNLTAWFQGSVEAGVAWDRLAQGPFMTMSVAIGFF